MLLRHASPLRNLASIQRFGLLTNKSRGKLPVIWLHAASKSAWAMLHSVKRHGGKVQDVIVLELDIPRRWLRRSRRGLWYCRRDIPPGRFRELLTFAMLAQSPVAENAA
jgi:hypothetical protein